MDPDNLIQPKHSSLMGEFVFCEDYKVLWIWRKNVSSFEIIMLAVYGPHSWFWHKAKKQFFKSNFVFFYNKSKILRILFIVEYEKITLFGGFLVLLGPIISRFFACSNEEKTTTKGQCSSPISMVCLGTQYIKYKGAGNTKE